MPRPKKNRKEASPGQSSQPSRLDELAWKTAQLAAILATRYPVPHGQPVDHVSKEGDWISLRDEADPRLDNFYYSLLRRAQFLLANANITRGDIHASQLFDPDRRYTLTEITQKFGEAAWRNLKSPNSVRKLIDKIADNIRAGVNEEMQHYLSMGLSLGEPESTNLVAPEELDKKIAHLLSHPELIATDERIPSEIKMRISLATLMHKELMPATTKQGPEKEYDAYGLFAYCADHKIMDDALWGLRSLLRGHYPL